MFPAKARDHGDLKTKSSHSTPPQLQPQSTAQVCDCQAQPTFGQLGFRLGPCPKPVYSLYKMFCREPTSDQTGTSQRYKVQRLILRACSCFYGLYPLKTENISEKKNTSILQQVQIFHSRQHFLNNRPQQVISVLLFGGGAKTQRD